MHTTEGLKHHSQTWLPHTEKFMACFVDEFPHFGSASTSRVEGNHHVIKSYVATLTWPSVGVKPNTWKSWGFGVLWDSRMFRARQQGAKHLALGCSWRRWKGLEI